MDNNLILSIPCRYYRVYTDADVPCDETNFHFVKRTLPVPVAEAALVLVDVWSTHYIDSWLARARQVTQEKIVPLLEAARRIGVEPRFCRGYEDTDLGMQAIRAAGMDAVDVRELLAK